jgi:hypothetical protein
MTRRDVEPTDNVSARILWPSVIFRNYAERTIMQSRRRDIAARRVFLAGLTPHISACALACSACHELVGRAEAARLQSQRHHRAKRFELLGGVGVQVDLGARSESVSAANTARIPVQSPTLKTRQCGAPEVHLDRVIEPPDGQ